MGGELLRQSDVRSTRRLFLSPSHAPLCPAQYGKTALGLSKDWGVSLTEANETLDRWYRYV